MTPGDVLVSFAGATVGYGAKAVVSDASFELRAGEVVGLVGPNAAGKSTLLRALTGGANVLSGDVSLAGTPLAALNSQERARLIGVVPQTPLSTFAFTARAFVEMGRNPHLGRLQDLSAEDRAVAREVMELTDTLRLAEETIDTLSGGDLQRLTVAQALAQQPRVLLLDEATAHLDLNHSLQVLDLVRHLADSGMAVLGVFHDLDLAARYSDRIAVVAQGRLSDAIAPELALDADVVSRVFDVRAVVRPDPVTGAVSVTPIVRGADVEGPSRGPVAVVCGSGTGAVLLRRLALAGVRATCGALSEGDVDLEVAKALGADSVRLPAFGEIDAAAEARVMAAFGNAAAVVVCDTPFGRANVGNLRAAARAGTRLVLVGEMTAARDYTGGPATELWAEAIAAGALRVSTDGDALAALLGMLDDEEKR